MKKRWLVIIGIACFVAAMSLAIPDRWWTGLIAIALIFIGGFFFVFGIYPDKKRIK